MYPDAAGARLVEVFCQLLKVPQQPGQVCGQFRSSAYEDRIYVLLKTLEFRRHSASADLPVDLLGDLCSQMDVRATDLGALLAVYRDTAGGAHPLEADAHVRTLSVTAAPCPGALHLPVAGIDVVFIAVGRTLYVVRRSEHPVHVGRRGLPLHVFTRIRGNDVVVLADHRVTVPDLRYYLRQAARPAYEKSLSIQVTEAATSVGEGTDPSADLWLDLGGVMPIVRAVDPRQNVLEVNGHPTNEMPVWLGDEVRCRHRRLDLRKLIAYAPRDTFVFTGANDVCTLSNAPQSSIYIPDAAVRPWNCQLESGQDGVRLRRGDCPHAFLKHGKAVRDDARLQAGDVLQVGDVQISLEQNAAGACKVTARDNRFSTVSINGVTHRFADGAPALDDLTFELQHGDFVCVLGSSGCGKSTLLSVLNGSVRPTNGDVLIDGASLFSHPAWRTCIGYVP